MPVSPLEPLRHILDETEYLMDASRDLGRAVPSDWSVAKMTTQEHRHSLREGGNAGDDDELFHG